MKAKIRKEKPKNVIFCDDCKYEFSMNAVDIDEAIIKVYGQELTLIYFVCPKCNKIYRVMLKDEKYNELKDDLDKIKIRIKKNFGSGRQEFASMLNSMANKKYERLKNHIKRLDEKFPGTFTFVASENNHEDKIIKYLP